MERLEKLEKKVAELESRLEHIENMLDIKSKAGNILSNVRKPLNGFVTLQRKVCRAGNAFVKEIKR